MTSTSADPATAWEPLPAAEWDAEAARHLLRRAAWSAQPAEVEQAAREGLPATLERLFPAAPNFFSEPASAVARPEAAPEYAARRRAAAGPEERRSIQREEQERIQEALQDLSLGWLAYACRPENAAFAKWTLFLGDIYVVASDKVRNPDLIWWHFYILARLGLGPAPLLTKAVARSPAMILYLDLNQSKAEAPNENFARELFELFILGEGNYTEKDIKESARAFTGYRLRQGREVVFAGRQHDWGMKTIFGRTGRFLGDDVIDLAYAQRAAGAFVPHELVKFYLCDQELPRESLYALGDLWRTEGGYSLGWLARRFFGSRLFYAPAYRANFIKSPVQFYLGLLQDLQLQPAPLPRYTLAPLRQMGQVLFNPPNVRGWVGGRSWINSTSLQARRTMAELLFDPLEGARLNADEARRLEAAQAGGAGPFTAGIDRLVPLLAGPAADSTGRMERQFLPLPPEPAFRRALADYLAGAGERPMERLRRARRAAVTLFETPDYQLC